MAMDTFLARCPTCHDFFRIALPDGVSQSFARFNPIKADCPGCGQAMATVASFPDDFGPARGMRLPTVQGSRPGEPHGPEQPLARGGSGAHVGQPGREQPFPRPSALPPSSGRGPRQNVIGQRSYSGGGYGYQSAASSARDLAAVYAWRLPAKRAVSAIVAGVYAAGSTASHVRGAIKALRAMGELSERMVDDVVGAQMTGGEKYAPFVAAASQSCPQCNQPAIEGPQFVREGVTLQDWSCPTCGYRYTARLISSAAERNGHNANGRGNSNPRGASSGPRQMLVGERRTVGFDQKQAALAVQYLANVPADFIAAALVRKAMAPRLHVDEREELLGAFQTAGELAGQLERQFAGESLHEFLVGV